MSSNNTGKPKGAKPTKYKRRPVCNVAICKSGLKENREYEASLSQKLIYHSFPKHTQLSKLWFSLCARKDKKKAIGAKICSEHFCQKQYRKGDHLKKKLLQRNAYPCSKIPRNTICNCDKRPHFEILKKKKMKKLPSPKKTKKCNPCKMSHKRRECCYVSSCLSGHKQNQEYETSLTTKIIYHTFPKNEILAKLWLSLCERKNGENYLFHGATICSEHFCTDQYRNLQRFLLESNAYPCMNIPNNMHCNCSNRPFFVMSSDKKRKKTPLKEKPENFNKQKIPAPNRSVTPKKIKLEVKRKKSAAPKKTKLEVKLKSGPYKPCLILPKPPVEDQPLSTSSNIIISSNHQLDHQISQTNSYSNMPSRLTPRIWPASVITANLSSQSKESTPASNTKLIIKIGPSQMCPLDVKPSCSGIPTEVSTEFSHYYSLQSSNEPLEFPMDIKVEEDLEIGTNYDLQQRSTQPSLPDLSALELNASSYNYSINEQQQDNMDDSSVIFNGNQPPVIQSSGLPPIFIVTADTFLCA